MCTYNGEKYLARQLESFARQTRLPDELVICDDGSTDGTVRILDDFSYGAKFPVRLFRNEVRLGSTKNFEKAVGLCDGQLIALSDQDDEWYSSKLALMHEVFGTYPAALAGFSDGDLIDDCSELIGRTLWGDLSFTPQQNSPYLGHAITSALFRLNYIATGATMVFRSELRSQFIPVPPDWFHDAWIAWIAACRDGLLAIPKSTIKYRIHPEQQVGLTPPSVLKQAALAKTNAPFFKLVSERLEVLRAHLDRDRSDPRIAELISELDKKIEFMRERASSNRSSVGRLIWILSSWRDYFLYARGPVSMISDALFVDAEVGDVARKA
jgi:glycosyltransferase involved in cell wall biosynthesis